MEQCGACPLVLALLESPICLPVCNQPSVIILTNTCRCGIALDAWMMPLNDEIYSKFSQPLFFINSEGFQTPANILSMKKCYAPGKERKMITIR